MVWRYPLFSSMDAAVDTLTDEEILAVLGQCNERLKTLTDQWREEVTTPRVQAATLHDGIVAAMQTKGLQAVQVCSDVFLRLQHKKRVINALTTELVSRVVSGLNAATFRTKMQHIDAERASRFAKWQEQQATVLRKAQRKATPTARKRNRTAVTAPPEPEAVEGKRRRMDEDEEPDPELGAAAGPPPPAICLPPVPGEGLDAPCVPRRVGKYLARPLPAMSRPLTRREALCAVLYGLVEDAHRAEKPVIAVSAASGRTAADKITLVDDADDELRGKAVTFCSLVTSSTAASAKIRAERPRYVHKMRDCQDRARAYIRTLAPDTRTLKRVLPTAEGDRTITFADTLDEAEGEGEGKADADPDPGNDDGSGIATNDDDEPAPVKEKLSLWTASDLIDRAVHAACARHDFIKHDQDSFFSYDDIPAITECGVLAAVRERLDALSHRALESDDTSSVMTAQTARSARSRGSSSSSLRIRRTRLRPCKDDPDAAPGTNDG